MEMERLPCPGQHSRFSTKSWRVPYKYVALET